MTRLDPHDGWTPQVQEQEQPPVFPEPTEAVRVHAETLPNAPATAPCCPRVETVQWNPYNGVVQCHSCGTIYDARAAREPAGAGLRGTLRIAVPEDHNPDGTLARWTTVADIIAGRSHTYSTIGVSVYLDWDASPAEPGLDAMARYILAHGEHSPFCAYTRGGEQCDCGLREAMDAALALSGPKP